MRFVGALGVRSRLEGFGLVVKESPRLPDLLVVDLIRGRPLGIGPQFTAVPIVRLMLKKLVDEIVQKKSLSDIICK